MEFFFFLISDSFVCMNKKLLLPALRGTDGEDSTELPWQPRADARTAFCSRASPVVIDRRSASALCRDLYCSCCCWSHPCSCSEQRRGPASPRISWPRWRFLAPAWQAGRRRWNISVRSGNSSLISVYTKTKERKSLWKDIKGCRGSSTSRWR